VRGPGNATGHTQDDQMRSIIEQEAKLREWLTREGDSVQKAVDGLDIGWGGVQRWPY